MTNFDPTKLDWASGLLAGWTYGEPVNKWFQGQFRHAHRLTRPCPTCTETIVLDVTTKALEGKATNHGLALRRCKKCRLALKAGPEAYAMRKAEAAPAVAAVAAAPVQTAVLPAAADPALTEELDRLRTANATMKEELEGLYAHNKELRERLAQYEGDDEPASVAQPAAVVPKPVVYGKLPPLDGFRVAKPQDLAAQAATEELRRKWLEKNPQAALLHDNALKPLDAAGQELLQKWLAKKNAKMPWEDA